MIFEMLILFIVVVIICFFLTVFTMEDQPVMAIPIILVGMIFSVLVTYGLWDVEWFYVGYNGTLNTSVPGVYDTTSYGDPFSYVFFIIFWIFVFLFLKTAVNVWKEAMQTKSEVDYNARKRR